MKCKEKREAKDVETVSMKNGKPAQQGICPVCSTKDVQDRCSYLGAFIKQKRPYSFHSTGVSRGFSGLSVWRWLYRLRCAPSPSALRWLCRWCEHSCLSAWHS